MDRLREFKREEDNPVQGGIRITPPLSSSDGTYEHNNIRGSSWEVGIEGILPEIKTAILRKEPRNIEIFKGMDDPRIVITISIGEPPTLEG